MSARSTTARNQNILTPEEVGICQKLAKLDIKLVSQRAQALLLINDGTTQADTAETSGLTIGQVRYLMIIFRKDGINIFPEKLLSALVTTTPEETEPDEKEVKEEKAAKAVKKPKSTSKKPKAKEKKEKKVKKSKKNNKKKAKKKKKKK